MSESSLNQAAWNLTENKFFPLCADHPHSDIHARPSWFGNLGVALVKGDETQDFQNGAVWRESVTYGSLRRVSISIILGPTKQHPYSPSLCTLLFLGGWLPILDIPIFHVIPGSIWFSIKVLFFLFVYIWVRAAFPRYRYDQLMRLGWKVFLPLSLAWVVFVSGVPVAFDWLP